MQRQLKGASARANNMRPAYTAIGLYMVARTQERIKSETSPDGSPFKPISPETIEDKKDRGQILKILQAEGTLIASIGLVVRPNGVQIGSNQKYASIHQLGGQAGRGKKVTIPARPYLGVNAIDVEEIEGIIEDHLLL